MATAHLQLPAQSFTSTKGLWLGFSVMSKGLLFLETCDFSPRQRRETSRRFCPALAAGVAEWEPTAGSLAERARSVCGRWPRRASPHLAARPYRLQVLLQKVFLNYVCNILSGMINPMFKFLKASLECKWLKIEASILLLGKVFCSSPHGYVKKCDSNSFKPAKAK